ncbi:MAG: hypothetical protein HY553_16170 [Elusimicrobia bacterium]|nr:hypothetical protein [Elusimicrobiota bacterium]
MNSFLMGAAVVLLVILVLDLVVAGGAMSMGMMGGVAGMIGTPWGWLLLVLLVVALIAAFAGR